MIKFIENKKNYLLFLAILFVVISLSDTTYSLFVKTDTIDNFEYTTGLIDLEFIEDEEIALSKTFPILDSEAKTLKPYSLTIKNTGTLTYKFNLKMVPNQTENIIENKYLKIQINDKLPHTLNESSNLLLKNIIINPGEELKFQIRLWLDYETPNTELGKSYSAKVMTEGAAIYKTLDDSGANYPNLKDTMLPINYDIENEYWKVADPSNMDEKNKWYDYDETMWANVGMFDNKDKFIYDVSGKYKLSVDNPKIFNNSLILGSEPLDIDLDYNSNVISSIIDIKINKLMPKVYILTNSKFAYYYDTITNKFVFTDGVNSVSSSKYKMKENENYRVSFTYDGSTIKFYINDILLNSSKINIDIISNKSLKIGTNLKNNEVSPITIENIYIYNTILSDKYIYTINNNNYEHESLVCGFNEFTPMTLYEFYNNKPFGTKINSNDISEYYVWIPRFKYKLWNVLGENQMPANTFPEIDLIFEKNKDTSGVVKCQSTTCYSDNNDEFILNKNDNTKYFTHPAFKYGEEELTGIWINKYETKLNDDLLKFYVEGNHPIKNIEWGALTYLSSSKYGLCKNNSCNNLVDSTTNNIYGVYNIKENDELTMSYYVEDMPLPENVNLKIDNYDILTKDIDIYYKNAFILGDATKEISTKPTWIDVNNRYILRNNLLDYKPTQRIGMYTRKVIK